MFLSNLSETLKFGEKLAGELMPKTTVLLKGPIGSGKTSLVQGIAKGLSIKESITSPTFGLSHHYYDGEIPLIHMDLYRLNNKFSAEELFLDELEELNQNNGILIIEWPDLIISLIESYWLIKISYAKYEGRNYQIFKPKESINLETSL